MLHTSNIIKSNLSQEFQRDGAAVSVRIFRHPHEQMWRMEVVSRDGQLTDWDEPFATDQEAWTEFVAIVEEE